MKVSINIDESISSDGASNAQSSMDENLIRQEPIKHKDSSGQSLDSSDLQNSKDAPKPKKVGYFKSKKNFLNFASIFIIILSLVSLVTWIINGALLAMSFAILRLDLIPPRQFG